MMLLTALCPFLFHILIGDRKALFLLHDILYTRKACDDIINIAIIFCFIINGTKSVLNR